MNFDPQWGQAGQNFSQMQQFWQDQWSKTLQSMMQNTPFQAMVPGFSQTPSGPLDASGMMKAFQQLAGGEDGIAPKLDPEKLKLVQEQYLQNIQKLYQPGGAGEAAAGWWPV